jgi:hypothetical protein
MQKAFSALTVNQLPSEVIAHIGSFIELKEDYNACFAAAKCFHSIKYNARRVRFSRLPLESDIQRIYKRSPSIKLVVFSYIAVDINDPQKTSQSLRLLRETYGDIEFILSFHEDADVTTILQHIPSHLCSIRMYLSRNNTHEKLHIPSNLKYIEMVIDNQDIHQDNIRNILPACDRLFISNIDMFAYEKMMDITHITEKTTLCVKLHTFMRIKKPLPHNKKYIDVVVHEPYSYMSHSIQDEIESFYADPDTHLYVKEWVVLPKTMDMHNENSFAYYAGMRYVHADAYVYMQTGTIVFYPFLHAYLKKTNKMGIIPLKKVYFMCIRKDDYIAARMLQILLSERSEGGPEGPERSEGGPGGGTCGPTIFVPYLSNQPYTSIYIKKWDLYNHMYHGQPITHQDIEMIQSISDIKQLYTMFEDETMKFCWSILA